MPDTETPMPTINSFYDNETSTEYAIEDTVARERADAAQETAEEALAAAGDASGAVFETTPAWVAYRNTYRGEYLGETTTEEQSEAIQAGTFDGLYVGDYWTRNGVDYLIADINYWLGTGDVPCTTPHLVIVPRTTLYNAQFNETNNTSGGYLGTKMHTTNLDNAKNMIKMAFGEDNILVHREYLTNAASNGVVSSAAWVDSTVDLMNQIMIFGSRVLNVSSSSGNQNRDDTIDNSQLALFRMNPALIRVENQQIIATRDIAGSTSVNIVNGINGSVAPSNLNNTGFGVRPAFAITG